MTQPVKFGNVQDNASKDAMPFYFPGGNSLEEGDRASRSKDTTDTTVVPKVHNRAHNITDVVEDFDSGEGVIENPVMLGNLDPVDSQRVFNEGSIPGTRVGYLLRNSQLIVFVDCIKAKTAYGDGTKRIAYEHRFRLNSPQAGISHHSGPFVVTDRDKPVALFTDEELDAMGSTLVYRIEYLLTNPV